MKVETELADGKVRLSFVFDGEDADKAFAERVAKGLGGLSFHPVRCLTDGNKEVDAKDDVFKVACAFKSAFLSCRALEEAKAIFVT